MENKKYYVDIVMCIDCTGSMAAILDTVKKNALNFYPDLKDALDAEGKIVNQLRVKVIGFRDFEADGAASLEVSKFFDISGNTADEAKNFEEFISGLVPKGGGDEPEDALEAISLAMNSEWCNIPDAKARHIIVVWTDASAHKLEDAKRDNPYYPAGMPISFNELTEKWEDKQDPVRSAASKRLIIFAPEVYPWSEIFANWSGATHYASIAGDGCSEVDYKAIVKQIVNSVEK